MNLKKVFLTLSLLLACAVSSFGQTALTMTTLAAAATSSATQIRLTSATGVTANTTIIYVDKEAMFVNAVNGTTINVTRGYQGSANSGHISLSMVLLGPPNAFYTTDAVGSCTPANTGFTPYVNILLGNQWICSSITNSWVPGFGNHDPGIMGVTAAVASVAGATLPSGPFFHVTGTNAITAWGSSTTVGAVGMGGGTSNATGASFCTLPDAAFTWTATNNIALAGTAVINKTICWYFDQTNKKYVPMQGA